MDFSPYVNTEALAACLAQAGAPAPFPHPRRALPPEDLGATWYAAYQTHRQRHRKGQFFTPKLLCDWMWALAAPQPHETILDPACGTGSFLLRGYDYLTAMAKEQPSLMTHEEALRQLIGWELDPQAAALCRYQLTYQVLPPRGHPRISVGNFLDWDSSSRDGPPVDVIIGNPPYVRQESLKHMGQVMARLQAQYAAYLERFPHQVALFQNKLDLYHLFFLQATCLLKPGGRLVFITSNSWLNTAIGQRFREFLCHHYHIRLVMESACEAWFADAAVTPVVVSLERCAPNLQKQFALETQFIRLRQPLASFMPERPLTDWPQLKKRLVQLQEAPEAFPVSSARIPQQQLYEHQQQSWSLHLRAPQQLSSLLEQSQNGMTLSDLGTVRYPLKTGINGFFYVTQAVVDRFGIEPEFLVPVLKSSREIQFYRISSVGKYFLFSCPLSPEALKTKGKEGALRYITWGQTQTAAPRQKRGQSVPWPQVKSVSHRAHWYQLQPLEPPHFLCPRFIDRRFFMAHCVTPLVEDQTFYGLTLAAPWQAKTDLIAALLNSTLSYWLMEMRGRTNLGEGVLQFSRQDMADFPIIRPDIFPEAEREELARLFQGLSQQPILPIAAEVKRPERVLLDELILKRLTPDNPRIIRERLVDSLLQGVDERHERARHRRDAQRMRSENGR